MARHKKLPHVYKKGKLFWWNYTRDGKRITSPHGFESKELAYDAYEEAIKGRAEKDTIEEIIDKYYELYGNEELSEGSLKNDRSFLRNYIIPVFGKRKVSEIEEIYLLNFKSELCKKLTHNSVNVAFIKLNKIFNWALKHKFITYNPVSEIEKFKLPDRNIVALDETQLFELLNSLHGQDKAIIAIGSLAGARIGEVFGFQWNDIDFDEGKISFERQITRCKVSNKLKTPASKATIDMLQDLIDILKEWKSYNKDSTWVIENTKKSFIIPRNWQDARWYKNIRIDFDFPEGFRFQDFRHTFACLLIHKGLYPKKVQKMMRHKTLAMTMDIYGKIFDEDIKEDIGRIKLKK